MNCAVKKSNQLCGLSMLCFIDPFVCGSGTQQSSPAAISFQQYHFSKLADSFAEAQQLVGNSSASLSQTFSSLIGKHNYTVISGWLVVCALALNLFVLPTHSQMIMLEMTRGKVS